MSERTMPCPHCDGTGRITFDLNLAFGANVKARRSELGITQEELSQKVRLSRAQVANVETGRSGATLEKLKAFADALDTTADALLAHPAARRTDTEGGEDE